jgi:SPP1 gp7 family putative phage head morphogenesis protein
MYWKKRFEMLEDARNKTAMGTVQSVTPAFDLAQAQIEKEINAWYARFAKNNQISLLEAKKLLNSKELKEFHWDVQEYIKYGRQNAIDQKWMKELENASARFHISRLEALKIRTQNAAERAFGNELDALDEMAARIYMDDYYHTAYEIQKGLGIGFDVSQIDERKLNSILSKPWTADKMTFSDRIWKSKTQLIDSVHTELTQMCVLGKAPDEAIRNIQKRMNVSKGQAGRLVMTEAAYFGSVAQKDCFNDLDVEKYEIVATLDNRTSDVCQQMDGKVFDMKDFQAGVTAPPFHVWCRSCTVPWFEDSNDGTRAARGADGKTYQVPANMKYSDWKEYFVDKTKDPADWLKPATVEDVVEAVKKFVPAKTIAEAEEYARQFADKVSFRGITNLDAINEINERLTYLTETYPIENLKDLVANSKLKRSHMRANFGLLEFNPNIVNANSVGDDWNARIKRNLEKIEQWKEYTDSKKYPKSTVTSYKKAIKEAEKENMFKRWTFDSETGKISDTVTHEYGHILADQYFGQINGVRANSHFGNAVDNPLRMQKRLVSDIYYKAKQNGDIYNLSMYASTDEYEFFAETFSMYVGGEKLPDYIEEMLKEVLKNGRL